MININKINLFFGRLGEMIIRFRYVNILLFMVVMGIAFAGLGKIKPDAGWDAWMLEKSPLKIADDEFKDIFGNSDYVAVMVEVDDLFTPGVLSKIRELGKELKQNVPFADDIQSITDCEFSLGNEFGFEIVNLVPDAIPEDSAELEKIRQLALSKELLKGKLVSRDSTQSWVMLRLHPFPKGWRDGNNKAADMVVGTKALEIIQQDKYAMLNPRAAGLPVLAHDKMGFFKNEMKRTMGLSLLASLIVLTMALRSVRGVLISILVAFGAVFITFGAQGLLGITIDVGMIVVPIYLGLAVAIGYSIHVFSFFDREFAQTGKRKAAIIHALEETGWPILFTALTTIGALASFHFVDVRPVRWIGSATSMLIFATFLLVLIMIPTLLSFGKDRKVENTENRETHFNHKLGHFMENFGIGVLARQKSIMTAFVIGVVFCGVGLTFLEVSFDIRKSMGLEVPYVARLDYVSHSEVGSLYSYNLVVEFNEDGLAREPENLKKFDSLMEEVKTFELTKRVTSIVEIIKDMNQVLNQGDRDFYTIPETREMVAQIMLLYENAGGKEAEKWIDYDYRRLRFMVDMENYNSLEAKSELMALKHKAEELFPDANVTLAGSIAQFTVMQDVVSRGQILSFLIAMGVITLMMMIVFGSVKTGLIAMIPNITPAIAVGGLMGWADIPLDMMTICIMPMLLGLAVDDTIHFINHAKLEYERTGDYHVSVRKTFSVIGVPLLLTSLIITANFSVYTTSVANVYINMGVLTGVGIMTALLTDYFVTPILLVWSKPFGK
ncbi:MAG: MMPL family transporter [Desulfobacteraceae bacterium]|nr:MMPL family transporter [Desulfobacteraceae bacterium]